MKPAYSANTPPSFPTTGADSSYFRCVEVGYVLLAVTVFLVVVVIPATSVRSQVALATPIDESESENLRLVNSTGRWDSHSSDNHGTLLPRVGKTMEQKTTKRVDPNNLRSLAAARARARARVSARQATLNTWGIGVGVAILLALVAWIFAISTAFPAVLAIVVTVVAVGLSGFFAFVFSSARQATAKDLTAIEKLDARLDVLKAQARTQDRPLSTTSAKKAPRQVALARAESARSAASAPSAVSAPETKVAPAKPVVKPAPTYTPKPVYQKRDIKPFVPEAAPTAAVPYRPKALGEQFAGAISASSAEAAPTIDTISFDDVLEARKHA